MAIIKPEEPTLVSSADKPSLPIPNIVGNIRDIKADIPSKAYTPGTPPTKMTLIESNIAMIDAKSNRL